MTPFDPKNWFWVVAGDESQAWSSAAGAYVETWHADQTTRIATEVELSNVLRPYGLTLPQSSQDDYKNSVQAHVDAVAVARRYSDGVSLASYKNSTVSEWASEAETFIAWRDQVWLTTYETLAEVVGGGIPQPTISELIALLPEPPWPA